MFDMAMTVLEKDGLKVAVGSGAVSLANLADKSDVNTSTPGKCINNDENQCINKCPCEYLTTIDVTIDYEAIHAAGRAEPADLDDRSLDSCANLDEAQCSKKCSSCTVYEAKAA
jgi:hypothetical protein